MKLTGIIKNLRIEGGNTSLLLLFLEVKQKL